MSASQPTAICIGVPCLMSDPFCLAHVMCLPASTHVNVSQNAVDVSESTECCLSTGCIEHAALRLWVVSVQRQSASALCYTPQERMSDGVLTRPLCGSLSLRAGLTVNSASTSSRLSFRLGSWSQNRCCKQVKSSFGSATYTEMTSRLM